MGRNDGAKSILKEIISGNINHPETYCELFEAALQENDKSLILEALREKYNEINKPDLLDLLENFAFYDQFTTSARFKKWIEVSKRFVLALDESPLKRQEYIDYWHKYSKKEMDALIEYIVLDRLAFSNLVIFTMDYLKTGGWNDNHRKRKIG